MKIDWKMAFICWVPLGILTVALGLLTKNLGLKFLIGQAIGGFGMLYTMKWWLK